MLSQISRRRLWQACNLKYLSHRVLFVKNNLRYEEVIWNKPNSRGDHFWNTYTKIFCLFDYYRVNTAIINVHDLSNVLQAIAITFNSQKRTNEIYLACGIKAMSPLLINQYIEQTLSSLTNKIKTRNGDMLDDLIAMEYIAPYSEFNTSIVKTLWNICRISIQQPFAFIPWAKKDIYYQRITEHSHKLIGIPVKYLE